jgi:hypothetical protein
MSQSKKDNITVRQYFTAIIKSAIGKSDAVSNLKHNLTKGVLRECIVSDILSEILPSQFGIGSGIIVNGDGDQSNQTDIIIYDSRILSPFIQKYNLGLYPIESVIAAIEVKTRLSKKDIEKTNGDAQKIHRMFKPPGNVRQANKNWKEVYNINSRPLCSIISFYGRGPRGLLNPNIGGKFLTEKAKDIFGICLVKQYSWLYLPPLGGWKQRLRDKNTNEETKRFFAVLLDNILTCSQARIAAKGTYHYDLYTAYIRN